jgi:hypothetical protein
MAHSGRTTIAMIAAIAPARAYAAVGASIATRRPPDAATTRACCIAAAFMASAHATDSD